MNILLIFDEDCCFESAKINFIKNDDQVFIFSLTSKTIFINQVIHQIKQLTDNIIFLESGKLINTTSEDLRSKYLEFIARIPNEVKSGKKNLKEYFSINREVSLWWFSLIAEKSPYKSGSFNELVQVECLIEVIISKKISKVLMGVNNSRFIKVIKDFLTENNLDFILLSLRKEKNLKEKIISLRYAVYFVNLIKLIKNAVSFYRLSGKIKGSVGGLKRELFKNDALMIVTFYPSINIELANQGIFKNKHFAYLQESLEKTEKDILWIGILVQNNMISFQESMNFAKVFIKNGFNLFFINEFVSVFDQIYCLWKMIISGIKFNLIQNRIRNAHSFGRYNFYEILREDWFSSFSGSIGYQGLLYFRMFNRILGNFQFTNCIYPTENHAWEKALINAKKIRNLSNKFFAYQPGTVTRMLLNYFNHPSELQNSDDYPFPVPDTLLVNGKIPQKYYMESGWKNDNVRIVEAIRYYHLKKYLNLNIVKKDKIILVGLSINPEESSSLLIMANEGLKNMQGYEIWVKPHPFLNLDLLFEKSGIKRSDCSFRFVDGLIEDYLKDARIIIVGESGVAIESLAFGCDIIYVNAPEFINMSPVKNIKSAIIHSASTPEELKKVVIEIFDRSFDPENMKMESLRVLNDFFEINMSSDYPEKFMKTLLPVNN